jgi:hypothetical protein
LMMLMMEYEMQMTVDTDPFFQKLLRRIHPYPVVTLGT